MSERDTNRSIAIGKIQHIHSREESIAVIKSGQLVPGDGTTTLSPEDEFDYRHSIAYTAGKFGRLERFMLSMYGRAYLDSPDLTEIFYKDVEQRTRHVGEIALFANLHNESGLAAVTIGFLGDTSRYPEHVRLNAQSANFNNTLGLSGLTRVRLETYQRVVMNQNHQVQLERSVIANTFRWNPFIVERIKLHEDLQTFVERRDMRVGEKEIKDWAKAHPEWQKYIEGTVRAVQTGTPNPIVDFWVPEGISGMDDIIDNLRSFENLLNFERDDDL